MQKCVSIHWVLHSTRNIYCSTYPYSSCFRGIFTTFSIVLLLKKRDNRNHNIYRRLDAAKLYIVKKSNQNRKPIHEQLPITDKNQNDVAFPFFHRLFTCLAI